MQNRPLNYQEIRSCYSQLHQWLQSQAFGATTALRSFVSIFLESVDVGELTWQKAIRLHEEIFSLNSKKLSFSIWAPFTMGNFLNCINIDACQTKRSHLMLMHTRWFNRTLKVSGHGFKAQGAFFQKQAAERSFTYIQATSYLLDTRPENYCIWRFDPGASRPSTGLRLAISEYGKIRK